MELRNWAGNVVFSTGVLHAPRTVAELQEVVAAAARVRALGTGHSFSRIADTDGALVTLESLDLPITVDAAGGTVTVPAGVRYAQLAEVLDAHGLALANLGSLPHISVAGSVATGTHGSGDGNRCLPTAAVGVSFVSGDGSLVSLAAGHPDFGGSVLALGAVGIATSLTLATVPAFEVRQDVWLDARLSAVLDDLDAVFAAGYSVSMFSSLRAPVIDRLWIKTAGPEAVDGRRWGARAAGVAQHPIAGQDASAATAQLGVPGPWHERLPHFRAEFTPSNGDEQQSEYLVPRRHAAQAIAALYSLDLQDALQVAEFRSVAADELWLSPCHGRDTVALHFTWVPSDARVGPAVRAVEAALAPFETRPHWGKVFTLPPDEVRAHYPRLPEFRALLERHDPNRTFGNAFLERFVY